MGTDNSKPEPETGDDSRLASLDARLREVQHAEQARTSHTPIGIGMSGKGSSQGHRVLSVLIGFPFGAALIGWVIDRFFATSPVAMLVMLFMGFGAAIYQVFRISAEHVE